MLEVLREMGQETSITLPLSFAQDLNWFIMFLQKINGITYFDQRISKTAIELV